MENKQHVTSGQLLELIASLFYMPGISLKTNCNYKDIANLVSAYLDSEIPGTNQILTVPIQNGRITKTFTYVHCVNVAIYSAMIGIGMRLNHNDLVDLTTAGLLHDIGKRYIPEEIILKPSELTDDEIKYVRMHPYYGEKFLRDTAMDVPLNVIFGIKEHHERLNGSGYPIHMSENISKIAQVIAIADMYDAFTAQRPYHEERSMEDGIKFLRNADGINKLIAELFITSLLKEGKQAEKIGCSNPDVQKPQTATFSNYVGNN